MEKQQKLYNKLQMQVDKKTLAVINQAGPL